MRGRVIALIDQVGNTISLLDVGGIHNSNAVMPLKLVVRGTCDMGYTHNEQVIELKPWGDPAEHA